MQEAGTSTKQGSKKFSFGKKKKQGTDAPAEEKKSGWSMPKIPDANQMKMMALKQSMTGGGMAKMFG